MPPLNVPSIGKQHKRFVDESESQHLANSEGGEVDAMEIASPTSRGGDILTMKQKNARRIRKKACKFCCMGSCFALLGCMLALYIQYPDPELWGRQVTQSDSFETLMYLYSSNNRRSYDAARAYYDSQRPLVLESARRFEASDAWTLGMHLDTYKMYYYDVVTVRTEMMLQRWLADPRNDDFLWEKDKCVMYTWFRRNGFPFSKILREWHDIPGSGEHVADVIAADMRNLSGHSPYGPHPITYPSWMKCCHLTQGHSHSTNKVHSISSVEGPSAHREWMESHWTERPNDNERPWAEAHNTLVNTIPPGFLLQENHRFDAEFKIMVVWGRAYFGYVAFPSEAKHLHLFRDNTTRWYSAELAGEHAAVVGAPNAHWLFTEGHMEKIWQYAEGVALASGIDFIRIDFFLERDSGALRLNENSLSSACSPIFRSECKFLSWAWAEPLVTREFLRYSTPLRTYEYSIFDQVNPAPNLDRAMQKLHGWVSPGPDMSGSTLHTSRWS